MRQPYWLGEPSLLNDLAAAPGMYMPPGFHPGGQGFMPQAPTLRPYYNAPQYQIAPQQSASVPYRRIMPTIPGAPALGFRDQSVGLGVATFTATSGVSLPLTGSPGRPFKGRRLMFDTSRVGTTSTGLLTITTFLIGDSNQLVGRGALLVNAFSPTSFGADGQYSACAPALTIALTITTSLAPSTTDTITVGGQFNGETIGG